MRYWLLVMLQSILVFSVAQQRKINVSVNTNLEVINMMTIPLNPEMLKDSAADPWMFNNTRVMRVAYNYFKPFYRDSDLAKARFIMDRIGTGIYLLALYYQDLPATKPLSAVPEIIWRELSTNRDSAFRVINDFMQIAAAFHTRSDFPGFRRKYAQVYKLALAQSEGNLPDKKFIQQLEAYYGSAKNSYNIVVFPFFKSDWGMGWETEHRQGRRDIFNISAPFQQQVIRNEKVVDAGFNNPDKIRNLSIHEFGHSFVNPLTSREPFASAIKKYNDLYKPIQSEPQYRDWSTLFNEYIVRAGEVLVMRQLGNKAFADKTLVDYKDWIYLDFFIRQMEYYNLNRQQYPSFSQFLPVLIDRLGELRQ